MKAFLSRKAARVWMIVSTILIILALIVNILALSMFNGLLDTVFGGVRPIYDNSMVSMYPS